MTKRAALGLASRAVCAVVFIACNGQKAAPRQYTVEKPPPSRTRKHAVHEHAHGTHPHGGSDHHHHSHPHPHVPGANGHHHAY